MFDDLIPQQDVTPTQRAFLTAMRGGESGGRYNVMHGGKTFDNFADHPRQPQPIMSGPNAGNVSTAAGADQFLARTWDEAKNALGLTDFSPRSQDRAAVWLAERDYKTRTGRNLWDDIESAKDNPGKLNYVGGVLSKTWTSLPGGAEPNRATGGFGQRLATEFSAAARQQPAQAASLSFDDLIPAQSPVEARSSSFQPPQNAQALQSGLQQQAAQMQAAARGPAADPLVRQSVEFQNQQIAGGQGTTPIMDLQAKNLITDQVFENDAGMAVFRDPATGQLVEADKNRHVMLRDPADNRLKVFARTEETNENPAVSGSRILAQGMAAGAATRRPAIPTPTRQDIVPRASDIISTSKPHYQAFDRASDAVGAVDSSAYPQRIKDAMAAGKVPQHLADEVYKSVDLIGENATLSDLRSIKELIGQSARSNDPRVRQAAGIASKEINRIIAETSREAGASLKTADEIFSTGKSVQDLQRKESVADLRAGRAGYGGNAVNSMRQVLSPVVQRAVEGKVTGFKPNEIEAMREIVEGTTTTNALRGIGQLSPSKGIIQTVGAGGAMYAAGPVALAVPAIGAASNKLATVLTGKQIDRLKELVVKRSPAYAEAVQKAVERYERAQMDLVNQPGANRLAAYVAASRQLANGLSRDGIQVSSADLMRSIQGPMRSAADNERPEPERVVNQ